jgi:hypothetical protein
MFILFICSPKFHLDREIRGGNNCVRVEARWIQRQAPSAAWNRLLLSLIIVFWVRLKAPFCALVYTSNIKRKTNDRAQLWYEQSSYSEMKVQSPNYICTWKTSNINRRKDMSKENNLPSLHDRSSYVPELVLEMDWWLAKEMVIPMGYENPSSPDFLRATLYNRMTCKMFTTYCDDFHNPIFFQFSQTIHGPQYFNI